MLKNLPSCSIEGLGPKDFDGHSRHAIFLETSYLKKNFIRFGRIKSLAYNMLKKYNLNDS